MQNFSPEKIIMIVLRHFGSLVYFYEDQYLNQKHSDQDKPGNEPHQKGKFYFLDLLRFIQGHKHQRTGKNHIADGGDDIPLKMILISRLNVSCEIRIIFNGISSPPSAM